MTQETLILIVGKSGAGKNYTCNKLKLNAIPSYTTRPMRKNEQEGREHRFVNEKVYLENFKEQELPAYTFFAGNHYWTTIEQFENQKYNAYIIDPKGVFWCLELINEDKIKRKIEIIYIECPWYTRLYRMMKRGDGIKKSIDRLINDAHEFESFILKLSKFVFNGLKIEVIKN